MSEDATEFANTWVERDTDALLGLVVALLGVWLSEALDTARSICWCITVCGRQGQQTDERQQALG